MKLFIAICTVLLSAEGSQSQVLSLSGNWTVKLDSADRSLPVRLPGTLDDAGIGNKHEVAPALDLATLVHLSRKVQYTGKAWYSRKFTAPAGWAGKSVQLILERVLWQSRVWIDGKDIGQQQESLVSPHVFDLSGSIRPGREQTISICVDNSNIYPGINVYGNQYPLKESKELAHAYTNHTQIKWNGVLGTIALRASPAIAIRQVDIYPDPGAGKIRFRIGLSGPAAGAAGSPGHHLHRGEYYVSAVVEDVRTGTRWEKGFSRRAEPGPGTDSLDAIAGDIPIPAGAKVWDEFDPALYRLLTVVRSASGNDSNTSRFGIREIGVKDSALWLNGHRMFVRGNLECVIFPKKGYPPTSVGEWRTLLNKAKSYGLNTFRFHSWCPPEEAFTAADEAGFYIHVELPHWNLQVGADTAAFRFLQQEAGRIIGRYGNHPSFLFFSMGNELEGDFSRLNGLVRELKQRDRRHLYTTTTFSFQKGGPISPQPEDDFFVSQRTKKGWVRGQGIFNDKAPEFGKDYSQAVSDISVPIISHEIGQYSVYPDINEIPEYTGNLQPNNFIAIKDDLEKKGLLYLAPDYLKATGRFAALLYKEEIERALKTKGFDGFHLLELQDFPGQGTALVGLLNAFWKSKGAITPEGFRQFCSEVVPLIRFPKAVYSNGEVFEAEVELANFYHPWSGGVLAWTISDGQGRLLARGDLEKRDFPIGNGLTAGKIAYHLNAVQKAERLTIEVSLKNTPYHNSWHIWVYPQSLPDNRGAVLVTQSLREAIAGLEEGKKVLLCPDPDTLKGITGKFVPVFWSPIHFANQPGTMGFLVKPGHKALGAFPTEFHSNWQWWDLAIHSKTLEIQGLPENAIIVRVIDNFVRNKNLGNLFEVRAGRGLLVFSAIDILSSPEKRLPARQLRFSLLNYMNSKDFHPAASMTIDQLRGFFR